MPEHPSCKIVVAEDDKFLARAYEFKLGRVGCQIVLAHDGDDAMNKIVSEKPDLVLLDIIMPKKTGFDILEEMKVRPELSSIPVIIMSNLGQEADIQKGMAAGAVDYVVKADTSLEQVVALIEKHLKTKMPPRRPEPPLPGGQAGPPRPSAVATFAECPGCHKPAPPAAKFCPECGGKLSA